MQFVELAAVQQCACVEKDPLPLKNLSPERQSNFFRSRAASEGSSGEAADRQRLRLRLGQMSPLQPFRWQARLWRKLGRHC